MDRADSRKYHFIYKTTCLVTNRWYIGMHSTNNLDDGYLGSGKRLWYSIKKHGIENHNREIVEFCTDRVSLSVREKEIINKEMLKESQCMNLKVGGEGGFTLLASINGGRSGIGGKTGGKIGGKINGAKNMSNGHSKGVETKRKNVTLATYGMLNKKAF